MVIILCCWSMQFWELSTVSEEEWTKGSNTGHKRRKTSMTEGKRK
jgi:hypothetical protein